MSGRNGRTPRQRKRLAWLAGTTKWRKLGNEEVVEEVLITNIGRKPPCYRLEHVVDGGKIKVGMLIKAPNGRKGYDVILDGENGYSAPTRRKAIVAFAKLEAASISAEAASISTEAACE